MTLVLVTGARGAIGKHVVVKAKARGARVVGVGHGVWASDRELANTDIDLWVNGIVDGDNLTSIVSAVGPPDVIVHLAGGSLVGSSITHPGEDFRRTVSSTHKLLEWIRLSAPKARLVVASSAAVYGQGHDSQIGEDVPLNPTSPYGTHKAVMEMLCRSHARQYGISIAILRLFSVYGPGLKKQLVWDLVARLSRGEQHLILGGYGDETRDFIAIDDAAEMLLAIAALADASVPTLNGCSGRPVKIVEAAAMLTGLFPDASFTFSGQRRDGDPHYLVGDPTRARAAGLKIITKLETGFPQTVDWIRSVLSEAHYDSRNSIV